MIKVEYRRGCCAGLRGVCTLDTSHLSVRVVETK